MKPLETRQGKSTIQMDASMTGFIDHQRIDQYHEFGIVLVRSEINRLVAHPLLETPQDIRLLTEDLCFAAAMMLDDFFFITIKVGTELRFWESPINSPSLCDYFIHQHQLTDQQKISALPQDEAIILYVLSTNASIALESQRTEHLTKQQKREVLSLANKYTSISLDAYNAIFPLPV